MKNVLLNPDRKDLGKMTTSDNERLLKMAAALAANPRGTIKEIAESAGISKATLHRLCGTRKALEHLLFQKSSDAVEDIICVVDKKHTDFEKGLEELIDVHLKYHEYIQLFFAYPEMAKEYNWSKYLESIDQFYLQGQKEGFFKIEFSDAFFSELFVSTVCGLIDAVDRGRVAPRGLTQSIKTFLLHGCGNPAAKYREA